MELLVGPELWLSAAVQVSAAQWDAGPWEWDLYQAESGLPSGILGCALKDDQR